MLLKLNLDNARPDSGFFLTGFKLSIMRSSLNDIDINKLKHNNLILNMARRLKMQHTEALRLLIKLKRSVALYRRRQRFDEEEILEQEELEQEQAVIKMREYFFNCK